MSKWLQDPQLQSQTDNPDGRRIFPRTSRKLTASSSSSSESNLGSQNTVLAALANEEKNHCWRTTDLPFLEITLFGPRRVESGTFWRTWLRNCCVSRAQEGGTVLIPWLLSERWNFATRRFHNSWEWQLHEWQAKDKCVCTATPALSTTELHRAKISCLHQYFL